MRCFRTTMQVYAQLQPAIDAAFRADYIDAGKCDHILPEQMPIAKDGKLYMALDETMLDDARAVSFLAMVEEVSQENYNAAVALSDGETRDVFIVPTPSTPEPSVGPFLDNNDEEREP